LKKHHAGFLLAVTGGLALVAFVVYRWRGFAWQQFLATLCNVDLRWLGLSVALILATYVGRALRWEVMLRPLIHRVTLLRVLAATCIGFTAVVLFGRAGEPVRPYLIAREAGVPFSTQVAAWVVERILDVLMILVIFGIALTQVGHSAVQPGPRIQTILQFGGAFTGITGGLLLAILFGLRHFRGQVQQRVKEALAFLPDRFQSRIEGFLIAFGEGAQSTRSSSFAFRLVAYTVVEWGVILGSFYCLFRAFPATARLDIFDVVIVLGFVCVGSVVQIPGVGGGVQIVTVLVLTEFYSLPLEAASGIALMWWVVSFVSIVPVGLLLAFREGLKWRSLRHIAPMAPGSA